MELTRSFVRRSMQRNAGHNCVQDILPSCIHQFSFYKQVLVQFGYDYSEIPSVCCKNLVLGVHACFPIVKGMIQEVVHHFEVSQRSDTEVKLTTKPCKSNLVCPFVVILSPVRFASVFIGVVLTFYKTTNTSDDETDVSLYLTSQKQESVQQQHQNSPTGPSAGGELSDDETDVSLYLTSQKQESNIN